MSKEQNIKNKDKELGIGSFKVGTYSLYKQGDSKYCHWSEGLKMIIEKDGVVMKLEGEEIGKIIKSLPRTVGSTY